MQQVATAPDGVPVFSDGAGKFFTQNGDGSMTEQFQGAKPDWLQQATGGASASGQPSYYNPSDPVHQAVMAAFQKKGIQPRDAADFQYWVNNINQSGGLQNGYKNQGGTGTWQDRMASASGGVGDYGSGGGGSPMGGGAGDWWTGQGVSPQEMASYGVPGSAYASKPFSGSYEPPAPPGVLASQFTLPTQAELEATPGYQARLKAAQQGLERGAAAKGSILSGGFVNAEGKAMQDYASNEYNNLVGQTLAGRGENQNEFQANVVAPGQFKYANQYKTYLDEQGRTLNDYLTNYNINRTGIQDFLAQQNRTADRGLSAITAGAPR